MLSELKQSEVGHVNLPARPESCDGGMTGVSERVLFRFAVARSRGFDDITYTGSSPATGLSGNEVAKVRTGTTDALTGAVDKTGTGCLGNVTKGSGSRTGGRCWGT